MGKNSKRTQKKSESAEDEFVVEKVVGRREVNGRVSVC